VADGGPYAAEHAGTVAERGTRLIDAQHFRLDRVEGAPDADCIAQYDAPLLALPLSGEVRGNVAAGEHPSASAGECLYATSIKALDFSAAGVTLLTRPS